MKAVKDVHNKPNLEEQNKITRLCLTGTGVVCGLDICVDDDYGLQVSKGNGITSDGKYIEVDQKKSFKYYQTFQTEGFENEALFSEATQVWELFEEPVGEPLKPQSSEEERTPFLRDKVVVLYLREDEQETDTEETGLKLHVLLMEQSDVLKAMNLSKIVTQILWHHAKDDDDFIYSDAYNTEDDRPQIETLNGAMNPAYRLPELYLQRLGFNNGDPFNCPPEGVDASVFPTIKSLDDLYQAYIPAIDDATTQLDKALSQLFDVFSPLLNCIDKENIKRWIALLCLKWETFKKENEEGEADTKYYIQYFYSWVRDLIQAYNELRLEIIHFTDDCCGHADEHSQYLLLGVALRIDLARQPQPLRHTFKQPPIYNNNADRLQRIRLYSWRVLMMIKNFYLPDYVQNPKVNSFKNFEEQDLMDFSKIKITPSRFYDQPLALQTIPFYYPVTWGRFSVHHFWNYERTKQATTDQLLSYHASDLDDSYTFQKQVIRPLHFQLNNYPFFRIEGHIGKPLEDEFSGESSNMQVSLGVKSQLEYIKRKYNLACHFVFIDVKNPLTQAYKIEIEAEEGPLAKEEYFSFYPELLGMEHISGVKEGGTFIVIYEERPINEAQGETAKIVIADFYIPYGKLNLPSFLIEDVTDERNKEIIEDQEKEEDNSGENDIRASLLKKVGKATANQKDDLQKVVGIGPKTEESLNDIGIYTYKQLGKASKLNDAEFTLLEENIAGLRGRYKWEKWIAQAKELLKGN